MLEVSPLEQHASKQPKEAVHQIPGRVFFKTTSTLAELAGVRAHIARQRVERLRAPCDEIDLLTTELRSLVIVVTAGLTAIVGIAALTAAEILAEVGDVRRFRTKAQFAMANGNCSPAGQLRPYQPPSAQPRW
jgi:transposase